MKRRYVYIVFCNVNPIIYGVYLNKQKALKYAQSLITYRRERARERGYPFDFYHYCLENKGKENEFDKKEKTIFSTCLKIKDNLEFSEDRCIIKVIRYPALT